MTFDFDREIERRGTCSLKYDFAVESGLPADVLPLWVADMDFPAPAPVLDALKKTVEHGIFGYSDAKEDYYAAVSGWFRERFGWETRREWLVKSPGVVFALAMAVRALTEEGDAVLIQPPVYRPFFSVVRENGRRVAENRLICRDGRYEIDFDDLERKLDEENVRMMILCSPHNPVCRVWTAEELRRVGELCAGRGVYVVSDEIHCDFAFPEHPHTVFTMACPELAERSIVCTAPSKTFNLAGLQASNIWIPGEDVRQRFRAEMARTGTSGLNVMGIIAAKTAYETGGPWLDACTAYMRENLSFLRSFLREHLPEIRLVEPEGTYFAWLDCSGLGLSGQELERLIIRDARLWLDGGHIFGGGAEQFQRVVLACTRKTLTEALERLERAVRALRQSRA
ncbi:MAG: pyridoxal phosphate-dependent aminotransferase [Oscillospiraceae bacterium]|nr:pyridoxal phosphate-dependent aminotransferase [Oscillospiraceae bacterium]